METDLRHWIIRVEIRCAVDLPPSKYQSEFSKLPSTFVETGWSIYSERPPDNQSLHITKIVNNENNPIFNESFVVEPPKSVHNKDGFLYVAMQDKNVYSENVPIYIPLSTMTSFLPYHFEVTTGKDKSDYQGVLYLSLVLEEIYSDNFLDSLVSFSVYSISLEPFPFKIKTLYIVVTTDEYEPKEIPYIKHNVNQSRNISQSVVEYSIKNERIWISPIIRIPSTKKKGEPECQFMMLKSMLGNKVNVYLMARDDNIPTIHPLPNTFIGVIRNVDMSLKTLLYADSDKNGSMPIEWVRDNKLFPAFSDVRGKLELNVRKKSEGRAADLSMELGRSQNTLADADMSLANKNGAEKYAYLLEKNNEVFDIIRKEKFKWKDLEREIETQNKTIQKLMKEIDDKTSSLKLTAAEVIDLKRKIGVVQNENRDIEIQANRLKSIEPEMVMNRKDLMAMDDEEVKNRVLEIAQAYRDERRRNEKLEKTLKKAQKDIAGRTHIISKMKGLEDNLRAMGNQSQALAREFKRSKGYKQTISKQETMILKLESILKNMADDTKNLRREYKKYEDEMIENSKLKNQIKNYQNADSLEQVLNKKDQIKKLDEEIHNLRAQLSSQRPRTAEKKEMFNKRLDIEIAYEREKSRAEALEREIEVSAQKYSREIVKLKAGIEEKNAFLRSIGMLET